MRTLINVRNIYQAVQREEICPRCRKEMKVTPLDIVQSIAEFTRKGKIVINKKGMCETHGYVSVARTVKSSVRVGLDGVPDYE